MAATLSAHHLTAAHAHRAVVYKLNRARQSLIKAGPARAGVKLGVAYKQRVAARGTAVYAVALFVQELARKGGLGPLISQNFVLLGCELFLPLFFASWHHILIFLMGLVAQVFVKANTQNNIDIQLR